MTSLDQSLSHTRHGSATVRRSSAKNPMESLTRIMENDPTASFGLLFKKWKKVIEHDTGLLDAVLLYAFRNYHSALDRDAPKEKTTADYQREREKIKAAVDEIRPHLVLNMRMANGKKLSECTFREVSDIGGVFKALAARGKPSQKVGDVLTNEDLRAFTL